MLKFLFVHPKLQVLNGLRCKVAIRTMISLVTVMLLAVLVSSCPSGKKRSSAQEACARISNTIMVNNECLCMQGYTKIAHSGVGSYDFQCQSQYGQACNGNAQMINGTCQCSNGRVYDHNNMSSPCGELSGGRQGLTIQQLQTACSGVQQATWQNGFCSCGTNQQFNALTRQCEPIVWHHTQTMCGTGATFYGHGNRGVCVCQNNNAVFHPSFGGCSTYVGSDVLGHLCSNVYGVNNGFVDGRCQCPAGRVWFRGSCLDLGHDFITQVPNLPETLRCELEGKRLVGTECQTYAGGYGGYGNGPVQPIVCERSALVGNVSTEKVVLFDGGVRVESRVGGRTFDRVYNPQEYFRERCEEYALGPGGFWVGGVGTFHPGVPPYFGHCKCGDPRGPAYTVEYEPNLGYSYCVAVGNHHLIPRCRRLALCGDGLNVSVGASGHVNVDVSVCTPDGKQMGFYYSR